jgi:glutathione synthase/RimK-type ligase-like ATP-grasp enzyme
MPASAGRLNENCRCVSVDLGRLRESVTALLGDAGLPGELAETHPHLFAVLPVFISTAHAERMAAVTAAIEAVAALPAYREAALAWAPPIARHDPLSRGAFLGLDFHLAPDGPQLIEINTNAGGALLSGLLAEAQRACCDEVRAVVPGSGTFAALERRVFEMFTTEWRLAGRTGMPRTVAIVDHNPENQYLHPEFLLFARLFDRFGLRAGVVDARRLEFRAGALYADGAPVDLVYNRLTDFAFDAPAHAALREAYLAGASVITPHPRAHALYADKRNLALLGDAPTLARLGASEAVVATLAAAIPRTAIVDAQDADRLWAERRRLFFKPFGGYGSRGAYRGDKLTRRVFEEILAGGYVAQALVPPTERVALSAEEPPLKLDLRNYAYRGEVQLVAARLWRGQTTNFRSAGGGFAPVFVVPEHRGRDALGPSET